MNISLCLAVLSALSSLHVVHAENTDSAKPSKQRLCRGEALPDGMYKEDMPLKAGYSAPASIELSKGVFSDVAMGFDASFIYWSASEEGLGYGSSAALVTANNGDVISVPTSNGRVFYINGGYSPGFKLGVSGTAKEWTLSGEYTWYRYSASQASNAPSTSFGTPVWVVNDMFQQTTTALQPLAGPHLDCSWKLKLDIADAVFSRPYYMGPNLVVVPFGGVRAVWIRQKMDANLTLASSTLSNPISGPVISKNSSVSWELGPRFGFDAQALFSNNFRFEGNLAGSILYSHYSVKHSENAASIGAIPSTVSFSFTGPNVVRTIFETGLGFGWGCYLQDRKYHFDIAANYDFSIYFDRNVIRKFLDEEVIGSGTPAGNLFLHGLTVRTKLDF